MNYPNGLNTESGRAVLESLLIAVAVSILLIAALDRFYSSVKPVKEIALRVELSSLRSAVTNYTVFNRRLPSSLKELVEKRIVIPVSPLEGADYRIELQGRYVEGMITDEEGNIADPFGNPYKYDGATGRVGSTSHGYEAW